MWNCCMFPFPSLMTQQKLTTELGESSSPNQFLMGSLVVSRVVILLASVISIKAMAAMLKPSWTSGRRLLEVYILQKCNHNTWEFHQLVLDTLFKFIQTDGGFRTIFQYYNDLMTWLICLDSYFRKPAYRAYIEPLYTVQTQTFDHRFRRSSPFCGSHSPNAATLPQGVHGTNAPVDRTGTMRKYGNKNEKNKASIMCKVLGTKMTVY